MLEKLLDIFLLNIHNRKIYAILLFLVLLFLAFFPYIDANFIYYSRMEKRINILQEVSQIDKEIIINDSILINEYDSIIKEIQRKTDKTEELFRINNDLKVSKIKFLTGCALSWLLAIACFFNKNFKTIAVRLFAVLLFIVLGLLLGILARMTPILFHPFTNYIGIPLIQLLILALILPRKSDSV